MKLTLPETGGCTHQHCPDPKHRVLPLKAVAPFLVAEGTRGAAFCRCSEHNLVAGLYLTRSKSYPPPRRRKACLKHSFKDVNKDPLSPELGAGSGTVSSLPKLLLTNWFRLLPHASSRKMSLLPKSQGRQGWAEPRAAQRA